jgi:BirA family biotin operon repressor/biotin-[acetyl-CoA-carboxylase] ligase
VEAARGWTAEWTTERPNHRTTERIDRLGVDALDRERILEGLTTRAIGRDLRVFGEVTSTNDVAMALADGGAPHGTAVVAERQTRGRGRLGRPWSSPPGLGLWVSVILRPSVRAGLAPSLTLLAGLAAAEAIEAEAMLAAALKWPNDVLLDGRKVAGVLAELRAEDQAVRHVVAGIGINVHQRRQDFPAELADAAISIQMATGRAVSRILLLRRLFLRLEAWIQTMAAEGATPVVAAAAARMPMLGCQVVAVSGQERWEGRAERLEDDGALLLALPDGATRRILAAQVTRGGVGDKGPGAGAGDRGA